MVKEDGYEHEARQFFLDWLASYLSKQNVKDHKIWQELRKEQWRTRHPNFQRLTRKLKLILKQAELFAVHLAKYILPTPVYYWLSAHWRGQAYLPPPGWVRFGHLRRMNPLSREFGYDRGVPIDRYYIEKFLYAHQSDIRGHVLEIAEDNYTRRFGGDRVTKSDVLHISADDLKATIVADLTSANHIPSNTFDCILLTQTLQFIYDVPSALQTVFRILKPGGVALVTVPGISPVSRYDMDRWGHYWNFTTQSARRLFEKVFPPGCINVDSFGNVLVGAAFLFGMAQGELSRKELDYRDSDYEVIITIRAAKPL
jgi:SAM-dependent methyltransferase